MGKQPLPRRIAALLLLCLLTPACLHQAGRDLTTGAAEGLEESGLPAFARDLGTNVGEGAKEGLLNDDTSERLQQLTDALADRLDERLPVLARRTVDEALDEETDAEIAELLTQLEEAVERILVDLEASADRTSENLVGEETRARIVQLRRALLDDETHDWVEEAGARLTGPRFQDNARGIGRSVIEGVAESYDTTLGPQLSSTIEEINGVLQDAGDSFNEWAVGFVVALLAGGGGIVYVVRKAARHRQTVEVLTSEIDRIPSRREYDDLIARIRKSVAERGLGNNLDSILREQSLIDQPEWEDRNRNLAEVVSEYVSRLPAGEAVGFVEQLRTLARQRGLEPADLPVE